MKKVLNTIYYLVLTLLVLLALVLVVSLLPIPGNIKTYTVLSGSMEPNIHTGSVVIVKSAQGYKAGDIITFGNGKTPITHRIVEVIKDNAQISYLTKGDANNANDAEKVPHNNVIGKVGVSLPYLGYILSWVRTPVGMVVLIAIPAIVVIWDQVKKIVDEVRRIKSKNKAEEPAEK